MQHAIDMHRVLYFPTGVYRLRGTLHLKPDSVLIGLNPVTSVLAVEDGDPNFKLAGPEVLVFLKLQPSLEPGVVQNLLDRLTQSWAQSEILATGVDSIGIKLVG